VYSALRPVKGFAEGLSLCGPVLRAVFPAVTPLDHLTPITVSSRLPSYQASANEPESNRHYLHYCCSWELPLPALSCGARLLTDTAWWPVMNFQLALDLQGLKSKLLSPRSAIIICAFTISYSTIRETSYLGQQCSALLGSLAYVAAFGNARL